VGVDEQPALDTARSRPYYVSLPGTSYRVSGAGPCRDTALFLSGVSSGNGWRYLDRVTPVLVFWSSPPKTGWLFENWVDAKTIPARFGPKDQDFPFS
jgi:hypothetical protein